jgi:nitric-oxide synthase, bacterial
VDVCAVKPPRSIHHSLLLNCNRRSALIALYERRMKLAEASQLLNQLQEEVAISHVEERLVQIQDEIKECGSYWQTSDELVYGAKLAWRNSTRCIGRLHWSSLQVRDMRYLTTAEEVFQALLEHIQLATHKGKIRSLITIFAPQAPNSPGIRIWNPQLIRYAGYVQPDGAVIGDPQYVELTELVTRLGWRGHPGSAFDILPLVIQMPGEEPRLFDLPSELILEVPIEHPRYEWFAYLGMKWHALPVISNMRLEIGGISYTAAPFNGWYMGTEIGARNFGDRGRYNVLPLIAERMGLNMCSERTLWRDLALVELNIAILHSFAQHGVSIVDHHTACRQFMLHEELEHKAGRSIAADWGWLVPPMSGSLTPVFHCAYENKIITPNFFPQPDPWHSIVGIPSAALSTRPPVQSGAIRRRLTLPIRNREDTTGLMTLSRQ